MAALTSYEMQTGRSLPTGVTSVVEGQPGQYVTGGATGYTTYVPKITIRKTPKYDANGKLLGYTVEEVDEDGKVLSSKFEQEAGSVGTTGRDLLKATLAELQIPSNILDSSVTFIEKLISDGIPVADATKIYYNNKNYTAKDGSTLSSPFYNEFTYLVESAPQTGNPPTPLELMQFKLGVKNLVTQYGRSSLFAADDALKGFISQGVKLTDLDARFAEAATEQLKADPNKVAALKALGYINSVQDVGDFYLDSKIGQKQFEINRNTAAFTQQAIARASYGITVDADRMKQLAAATGATTGTAANAEQLGATGFETIAQQLNPLTKLEGIYNKSAVAQSALTPEIQKQLEAEQFQGTASELRKKRIEQEQLAFQAKSGIAQASRLSQGSLGTGSTSGLI